MKERILVVDDDAAIRHMLERILSPNYEVVTAASPEEAMEAMAREGFDLALIDVHLHASGDGYELCHRVKQATPETDVILITGSVSQPDQKLYRSLEEGAFYFLFKPFERKVLRALVDRCLDLQRERRAKENYARALAADLEQARAFQASLMPRRGLERSGWSLAGTCLPCDALGGDYFHWLAEPDGSITFAVVDVVGHGVGAAMYAGMLRSTLDAARRLDPEPEAVVRQTLTGIDFFEAGRYASMFYGRLYSDGRLRYVNAGHPAALLVTPDGAIERLSATGLFLTATLPDLARPAQEIRIARGSRLVACTDGVIETLDPREREFGVQRLEQAVLDCSAAGPAESVDVVLRRLAAHREGRPLTDDVTLLVVERNA